MARNEEKHVTRLNRLLLQQQREEAEKKNPKRPHLNTLNSAGEIQKWLPSIKKDLDFYLKQSQVNCYPARKIEEFSLEIERLKKEYHAFVRKLKQHDPSLKSVPWTERPYGIRTKVGRTKDKVKTVQSSSEDLARKPNVEDFVKITTPILDKDEEYGQLYGYDRVDGQQSPNLHSYLPFDNHHQAPSLVEKDQNQLSVTGTYQDDKPLTSSTQNEKDFCLWNKPLDFVSIKSAVPDKNTAAQTLTRVSSKFGIDAHTANIHAFDEYYTSTHYLPDNVLDSASENLGTRQPASQKTVGCSSDLNQVNALKCLASEYCEVSSDSDSDAAKT